MGEVPTSVTPLPFFGLTRKRRQKFFGAAHAVDDKEKKANEREPRMENRMPSGRLDRRARWIGGKCAHFGLNFR